MTRLTDSIDDNYSLFIEEIRFNGELWGIESEDGWVVVDSQEFENTDVIPFWSDKEDAAVHCVEEWADYQISKIEVEDFVQEWLPELDADGVLVGANWNAELEGVEVESLQLAEALAGADID
ncbi:DUF2750 domain-containing protein [Oceanospirillum maris]|jgi:hypothetical protein|uniref:DUF2750 domain-containing protein n=1 Tax=Oceanospirillum maris TaxID=64977 RepID=UPI0004098C80|nr:DUF2750 domain-containing protein [Oceanospirillum maris]